MDELLELGIELAGQWILSDDNIDFEIKDFSNCKSILYSFISVNEILYIGKSDNSFENRMKNYKYAHNFQKTNIRINSNIKDLLVSGKHVNIFIFTDNGDFVYKTIPVKLNS